MKGKSNPDPEFNQFSRSYDELLQDPIRDVFSGSSGDFFHLQKRDLIRSYFRRRNKSTSSLSYLDLGCGKGELITLLDDDFNRVAGCDPSSGMLAGIMSAGKSMDLRVQEDPGKIPFQDGEFDLVTAVCVFHHVPIAARPALVAEMARVLKPGGRIAIIEHNPYNPITRLIVARTPVDVDAILLNHSETESLLNGAGLQIDERRFFLFFPRPLYSLMPRVEDALGAIPLGGQYAVFATLP